MIYQLGPVLFMAALSLVFGVVVLFLVSKVGPKIKPSKAKLESYESGISGQQTSTTKIPVKFYLTAILFIVFDIEAIFIYPWATVFKDFIAEGYGTFIFVEMLVFMATLVWGLFYIWKGKALDWE
jgi:NADH-quinone oxidoreductase subunit A